MPSHGGAAIVNGAAAGGGGCGHRGTAHAGMSGGVFVVSSWFEQCCFWSNGRQSGEGREQ